MDKIKVTSKEEKRRGQGTKGEWIIYTVTDEAGEKLDTFDNLEVGKEYEGEIVTPDNPTFNRQFKQHKFKKQTKPGTGINEELSKSICALNNACLLASTGAIEIKKIGEFADNFKKYLDN